MSMMEQIRRSTDSTWMKIVFGIIVVVFVFWGVVPTGATNQEIVTVNGSRLTDVELNQVMKEIRRTLPADMQGQLNEHDERKLREEGIAELVRREVLQQEAERLGLEVSETEIGLYLKRMTTSQGDALFSVNGVFDEERYSDYLEQTGYDQNSFKEKIRRQILREKLAYLARSSVTVSDQEVWESYLRIGKRVGYSVIKISDAAIASKIAPDPEAISAWRAENEAALEASLAEQATRERQDIASELIPDDYVPPGDDSTEDDSPAELDPEATRAEWMASNSEAIDTEYEARKPALLAEAATTMWIADMASKRSEAIATELHELWMDAGELPQARIDELSQEFGRSIEQRLSQPVEVSTRPETFNIWIPQPPPSPQVGMAGWVMDNQQAIEAAMLDSRQELIDVLPETLARELLEADLAREIMTQELAVDLIKEEYAREQMGSDTAGEADVTAWITQNADDLGSVFEEKTSPSAVSAWSSENAEALSAAAETRITDIALSSWMRRNAEATQQTFDAEITAEALATLRTERAEEISSLVEERTERFRQEIGLGMLLDAQQSYAAAAAAPGLMDELIDAESAGVLPVPKPTPDGWVLVKVDSVILPTREEFDAATSFDLGVPPNSDEVFSLGKEDIRGQIWQETASSFYSRWVRDLVARADVEQAYIP